jgi:hypothetical protein
MARECGRKAACAEVIHRPFGRGVDGALTLPVVAILTMIRPVSSA